MIENNNSIGMNELVDYKKKEYGSFMNWLMRFLWKCGGSDAQILQYAPYSDHIKAAGIGGVVLATTVMASIAMGFAIHTIFAAPTDQIDPITKEVILQGNWFITIPVAIVWGLIIFNLDRFIVSTVKGDGTEKITLGEWGSMIPRLLMAIIIGLTISAPLETYIFSKEINRELNQSRALTIQMKKNEIETRYENLIKEKELIKKEKQIKLDSLESKRAFYENEVMKETNVVTCGSKCIAKKEQQAKFLNEVYIPVQREFQKADKEFQDLVKEKSSMIKAKESETEKEPFGFLDQILALEQLSNPKTITIKDNVTGKAEVKEIRGSGAAAIWLVRLLFMIVEIAPVIFKFMIWKTSYDYMQENVSQILEAKQGIALEYITDDKNNLHKVKENFNARRIAEVAKRQNELEKENAIHAITLYAEQEREKIEKDPESYIQSDSDNKKS